MNKGIIFSTLLLFNVICNAQTIADFDGTTMSGVTISGSETDQAVFDLVANNPLQAGINTSSNCLHIQTKQDIANAIPEWWRNVINITFDTPITLTEDNRYFHVMHLREEMRSGYWLVYAADGSGAAAVEISRGSVPAANQWVDIVADMKSKLSSIKTIQIIIDGNWDGSGESRYYAPTNFYYDAMELSGEANGRGEQLITDQNLLDFEDETATKARINVISQNTAYTTDIACINMDDTGVNTSSYCALFSGNTVQPQWWEGFQFDFKSTVDATEYAYLHFMMKKNVVEAGYNTVITLVNTDGTQTDDNLFLHELTTEWKDYVMTIPETHKRIKTIYVKFNAASPATECYIDEIYMDNDPNPRTASQNPTYLEKHVTGNCYYGADTETLFLNHAATVNIYDMFGRLVLTVNGKTEIDLSMLETGIYAAVINDRVLKFRK